MLPCDAVSDWKKHQHAGIGIRVIGVGGITETEYANKLIQEEKVDLVAVGRGLLNDADWAVKAIKKLKVWLFEVIVGKTKTHIVKFVKHSGLQLREDERLRLLKDAK